MKKIMVWVIGCALLVCFVSTGESNAGKKVSTEAGFIKGYYNKLVPGPKDGAKFRWLKPDVDFSRYKKVMLDSVIFFFADESKYKGIDANEMKELTDSFNLEMVNALKDKYPIVSQPGPDVMRVRFAITNIKQSNPGVSAITTVIPVGLAVRNIKQSNPGVSAITTVVPVGLAVSLVKKGAKDSWTGSGATAMEGMWIDTVSGEVVAAAQDHRSAGFSKRFSKWGSAKEAFKFWAERSRYFLDLVREETSE
jgi:phage tail protein X